MRDSSPASPPPPAMSGRRRFWYRPAGSSRLALVGRTVAGGDARLHALAAGAPLP
ncbi:hypothetical protein [Geminisphaera colitermitum]|uniref:hypothetical protein n=1 Tax=Geminisphaera colitermitum TaxID=1148786 RepID=UPI001E5B62F1|nr:hypothetical protein [Geminisphaera colitermitum]